MPRFFFDIQDNELTSDHEGMEFPGARDAVRHAIAALPAIAAHETNDEQGVRDGLTVLVRDAAGATVYSATLSLHGTWLTRHGRPPDQPQTAKRIKGSTRH